MAVNLQQAQSSGEVGGVLGPGGTGSGPPCSPEAGKPCRSPWSSMLTSMGSTGDKEQGIQEVAAALSYLHLRNQGQASEAPPGFSPSAGTSEGTGPAWPQASGLSPSQRLAGYRAAVEEASAALGGEGEGEAGDLGQQLVIQGVLGKVGVAGASVLVVYAHLPNCTECQL